MRFGVYDDIGSNLIPSISIAHAQKTSTATGSEVQLTGGPVWIMIDITAIGAADATHFFTFTITQAIATGGSFSAATAATQYKVKGSWDRIINATTETGIETFQFIPKATYDFIKVVATESAGGSADVTMVAYVIQGGITQPENA